MNKLIIAMLVAATCSMSFADYNQDMSVKYYNKGLEQRAANDLESAKSSFSFAVSCDAENTAAQEALRVTNERLDASYPEKGIAKKPKKSSEEFSLRAAVGTMPGIDDGNFDAQDGIRIEGLAVTRIWSSNHPKVGAVFGGGFFMSESSGKLLANELTLTSFGVMAEGGIAVQLAEPLVLELLPYVAIGTCKRKLSTLSQSDKESIFIYGIKSGLFWEITEHIELGLEMGYEKFDVEWTGSGMHAALVFSAKF